MSTTPAAARTTAPRATAPRATAPRAAALSTAAPRIDVPEPDAFTQPYWDAAAEGRLLLRRCTACGRAHHYPREFCPHCWSEDVEWEQASGRAVLYTWSVVHVNDLPPFRARLPYVAAVVELVEGPRIMTTVVDCDPTRLQIGMELVADFVAFVADDEPGPPVPVFRTAEAP